MKRLLALFQIVALSLMYSPAGSGAAWKACNGTPVGVKYAPMGLFWDQCSIPPDSPQERAFFTGLYETRYYATALGFGSGYKYIDNGNCIIDHDNDRSDVALVTRADIDGALGLTMAETDGCNFSWESEHIVTADVMVAGDLDFTRPDESRVISLAPENTGAKMGAVAMLHELGHALGLAHSNDFSIMRNGLGARVPFVGMWPNAGGLNSELMGDDVYGISQIYGFDPSYRNVFVSSQQLVNGALVDNDNGQGDLPVCAGDKVTVTATIGNDSSTRESFQVSVYIDPAIDALTGFDGGLIFYNISMGRGVYSFPAQFTVPASMPVNVIENVYVGLPSTLLWDRKAYDNGARSRLRIRRKAGC
jgi:hypothetical protein